MPNTKFVNKLQFLNQIKSIIQNKHLEYQKIKTILNEHGYLVDKNTYHFISSYLKPKDRIERNLFYLLLNVLSKSESLSGGSSEIGFLFGLIFLQEFMLYYDNIEQLNEERIKKEFFDSLEELKNLINNNSHQVNENNFFSLLQTKNKLPENIALVGYEALKLAGLEGKIYIEDGKQNNFIIEKKTGFNFKCKPYKFFLNEFNLSWEANNVRIFLIDGIIETIGELDKIINKSFETKQPLVIIAKGYTEEVIATLKVNFDRNLLNIIPVKINSDLESINLLNDIACVVNTDIVASFKGDLISFKNWDDLKIVKKIKCTSNSITFEDESNLGSVNQQLKYLLDKRQNNVLVDDIKDLIDERIKSLTSNSVVIHLPNVSMIENQTIRTQLDILFRDSKTLLNYGIVNLEEIINNFVDSKNINANTIIASALKKLKAEILYSEVSALSLFLGIYFSCQQILNIVLSNGFIEIIDQP